MSQAVLARQFIRDAAGQPFAVILPIEEYALIRPILEEQEQRLEREVQEIALAANDPLFLSDLRESMAAFETADRDWWEHEV